MRTTGIDREVFHICVYEYTYFRKKERPSRRTFVVRNSPLITDWPTGRHKERIPYRSLNNNLTFSRRRTAYWNADKVAQSPPWRSTTFYWMQPTFLAHLKCIKLLHPASPIRIIKSLTVLLNPWRSSSAHRSCLFNRDQCHQDVSIHWMWCR